MREPTLEEIFDALAQAFLALAEAVAEHFGNDGARPPAPGPRPPWSRTTRHHHDTASIHNPARARTAHQPDPRRPRHRGHHTGRTGP